MEFLNFYLLLWVMFCPPGSGSGYGSIDLIESGSGSETLIFPVGGEDA
jgi:hypothetical protein